MLKKINGAKAEDASTAQEEANRALVQSFKDEKKFLNLAS